MTSRKLLFAAALSAAAGCEPASPLTTARGPCCGNIGQRGREDAVVEPIAMPVVDAPAPAVAMPVVEPEPAPKQVAKRRARPRPRPLTRATPAAEPAPAPAAVQATMAQPLLNDRERPACGNVVTRAGTRRVCR